MMGGTREGKISANRFPTCGGQLMLKTHQWKLGVALVVLMLAGTVHPLEAQLTRGFRSEEHTSELQSRENLVCRLLLEKKKKKKYLDAYYQIKNKTKQNY